jgi:hypothetical protein
MEENNQVLGQKATSSTFKFKEKRKWQIALRRYILQNNQTSSYAPYFGLDIQGFRSWIELQFTEELNWDNFGIAWQLDHIVPVAFFDFEREQDLYLCWSFVNIRVERLDEQNNRANKAALLVVRNYFEDLFNKTGLHVCRQMVYRIEQMEISVSLYNYKLENFINENKEKLEALIGLTAGEMSLFNQGTTIKDILLQKDILKKFG